MPLIKLRELERISQSPTAQTIDSRLKLLPYINKKPVVENSMILQERKRSVPLQNPTANRSVFRAQQLSLVDRQGALQEKLKQMYNPVPKVIRHNEAGRRKNLSPQPSVAQLTRAAEKPQSVTAK